MRENEPLEACRVFKISGVRELINNISSKDLIKYKNGLKIIGLNRFNQFKNLYIEQRNHPELTPHDVMNFLIKKRIFSPSLKFNFLHFFKKKSFRCNQCGLVSNLKYRLFLENWKCGYCGFEHYLPQYITEYFNKYEIEIWKYKKSKLCALDNSQEGAIPVILTLLQIKHRFHSSNFMFSTALDLTSEFGNKCETDLVVMNYHNGEEIEIGIGECKSDKGNIDQKDIRNLKAIRAKFISKGLKCYLIFSKTSDSFTKKEITLFKSLQAEYIYPVLFLNKELEPYELYENHQNNKLPRPYAFSLEDMAINSEYIYLRN